MTINRVLCYLHADHESVRYVRARRTRRRALEILERLPDSPAVEISVASLESFADGHGRMSWYFTSPEHVADALPFDDDTTLNDAIDALVHGIRGHVEILMQAAADLEAAR